MSPQPSRAYLRVLRRTSASLMHQTPWALLRNSCTFRQPFHGEEKQRSDRCCMSHAVPSL